MLEQEIDEKIASVAEHAKDGAEKIVILQMSKYAARFVARLRSRADKTRLPFNIDDRVVDVLEKELRDFVEEELK